MRPSALLIAGPTAAGKSALAVALAGKLNGEVINADSMQVYSGLHILSARPNEAEMAGVPHHLFGVLSPGDGCSVQRWLDLAAAVVEDIRLRGKLPILVGGTGLYFRAALEGLAPVPEIPAHIREQVRDLAEAEGVEALALALAAHDPVMAGRLDPGDRQRQARALEVVLATGRSLADWQTGSDTKAGTLKRLFDPEDVDVVKFVVSMPRESLYGRINARFETMMAAGALDEVRALPDGPGTADLPALRALGVRPLRAHLAGQLSQEDAITRAQTDSRHYAKRQLTWFRNQCADWLWLDGLPEKDDDLVDALVSQALVHIGA